MVRWLTTSDRPMAQGMPSARAQAASPNEEALVDALMAFVRLRGMDLEINPAVIGSRNDVLRLIQEAEGPLMQGWKRTVIGDDLQRLLEGELALQIRQGRLCVAPVK